MALSGVITYRMLEFVEIDEGHWCPRCALPSAARISIASITEIGGVEGPMKLSTRLRCSDGHGWLEPLV